jgi:NitT/TauT family transport system substrate-binding protein
MPHDNTQKRRGQISRRSFLKSCAAGLVCGGAFVTLPKSGRTAGTQELHVQLDWLMSNGQTGDVVALKKGFFEEEGLNVVFQPGGPNAQTAPPVVTGRSMVGQFSGTGQTMVARGNGLPVKIFACGYRTAPFNFFSLPRAPIRKPQDMIGKRIGIQPTARFVLDIILQENNIDPKSLEIVTIGWDMMPLLTDQVDAITGWITNTKALAVIGPDRIDMSEKDAGLFSYADVYFTSEETLEKHPDLLTKYLRGAARGWEWTYHNREAAVDVLTAAYPNLDNEIEKATIDTVIKLSFDEETKANGWGWFSEEKISKQIEQYDKVGRFEKRKPTFSELITMDMLNASADVRPKLG